MIPNIRIGVGWSTDFPRPWPNQINYRPLRAAYRAPSFFLESMLGGGSVVGFIKFDEQLQIEQLVGSSASLGARINVLYLVSHGENHNGQYQLDLHKGDWSPAVSGIGDISPTVIVFDTCDLVDLESPNWATYWQSPKIPKTLRIVFGFSSQATVTEETSKASQILRRRHNQGEDNLRGLASRCSLHHLPWTRQTNRAGTWGRST